MPRLVFLFTLVLTLTASLAAAQSLADVARKEQARRKTVKHATKVYTNKDLKPVVPGGPVTAGQPAPEAAAAEEKAGAEKPEGEAQPEGEEDTRAQDEQQWRARMAEARSGLDRNRMFAEALQSRINGLWADFTARDDPAQRAAIELQRQRAIAELDRVKGEIQAQTKAIADLEEEARRAGVPPGWLR